MLTERQREVLDFIVAFSGEHGYPPSFRDIGLKFGWSSPNAVLGFIRALETKGFIARHFSGNRSTARGIRVLDEGSVKTCWGRMPIGV